MKLVLSLQHKEIPANLHFKNPSPHIPWDDIPFIVPTKAMPWPEIGGTRVGGISSFGFSGTNVHVVVEQAPPAIVPKVTVQRELIFSLYRHSVRPLSRSQPIVSCKSWMVATMLNLVILPTHSILGGLSCRYELLSLPAPWLKRAKN